MIDRQYIANALLAAPLLAAVSVPILFAMVAVRLTSPGPAIFKQTRYGLNVQPFTIYKIRTMTEERDAGGNLLLEQNRITRVGAFLRKTSIDEWPQLWNILKGDMAFIGPRPLPMDSDLPGFSARYAVRPGMTGLAQIAFKTEPHLQGLIDDTPETMSLRLPYDLEYITKRGLTMKLRILYRTARIILSRGNTSLQRPPRSAAGQDIDCPPPQ